MPDHARIPLRSTDLWLEDGSAGHVRIYSDASLALTEHRLNEVGTFIWKQCDGQRDVRAIAELLQAECGESAPSIDDLLLDVDGFLASLEASGLIAWAEDRAPNVLLVSPPFPSQYSAKAAQTPEYSAPPLGLCYIAAVLRDNHTPVSIVDMHQAASLPEDIISECRRLRPRIVGITTTTPTFPNAVRVARFVKAFDEQVIVVFGGAHATCAPEECLRTGVVDYVCIGEGEHAMLELSRAIIHGGEAPGTPGFAYLNPDGEVAFSQKRSNLTDLDALPYPAWDLVSLDSYFQKGSVVSSRGCPFNCNYCACAVIAGRECRTRSIDRVLDEIEHLMSAYGIKFIDFHDDTFNLHESRVLEFCEKLEERGMNFTWGVFCRAAQFTERMAQAMASAGCRVVQFGVESGSQRILDSIRKNTRLDQVSDAVIMARSAGIERIACGFIIGHAEDTEQTIRETMDFGLHLASLGATRLTLSLLTPYPGTEVFDSMHQSGINLITQDYERFIFSRVVTKTNHLDSETLRQLYAEGIQKFVSASSA